MAGRDKLKPRNKALAKFAPEPAKPPIRVKNNILSACQPKLSPALFALP